MITIITGTPGAGKTLYTVEHYISKIIGTTVTKHHDDGSTEEIPRTIYTNINGLTLDHELIDGCDEGGLNNWHEWAKPGAVIIFDEVQKIWKPRPNGSKIPPYIEALETHRHMGVDFILLTQGVMLTDRNLIALAGQHLHIRRLGNSKTCIVYEWDHVSRSLMYSKSVAKKLWRHKPKFYKLYKSAELHTKQKRSMPTILWFLAAAVVAGVYLLPRVAGIFDPTSSDGIEMAHALGDHDVMTYTQPPVRQGFAQGQTKTVAQFVESYQPRIPDVPYTAPVYDHLTMPQAVPKPAACIQMGERCDCYTQRGTPYDTSRQICLHYVKSGVFLDFEPDSAPAGAALPMMAIPPSS